ncbi:amidase [Streptomyces sp. SID8375]|uniref:Amidase n=1 Tax=Streptomyces nigrescens TaxID=1920 RepID=A0A640TQT8_STRNI|nr:MULTISPECIES: amidase [Streptomyces]MCX5451042.1 amidase [Streptomyces libani]MYX10248.1 amidase [Streptomyces sp. SID8375]WAT99904.1 amidase [Streptomyces libani subsp. libani]WDT54325.1 amidase [Streptomyces sp. G7(2002)]GFE25898.1 amidase [Streptomyces libani subsp. libani]
MAELHDLTALEQAQGIRSGELSPVEITEHFLARIERLDDTLGAFLTRTPDLARKQASDAESEATAARREGRELPPLHGVPVPVKDLNQVAGVRCTMGSRALAEHVPTVDDHVVGKLRAGGTILLGKTNTPEFGLPCYTENGLAPPARTPWDLARSAGGSSGGAAAAVAAGLAPVAHASDGGGSIRIPASVCGLFGIKPSRGRISSGPLLHDVSGLATSGPLARTVADAATLLDVLAGPMPGDPFTAPPLPPGETFAAHALRDPGRLRIACLTEAPVPGIEVHPDCRTATTETAALLTGLGHEVEELSLPSDDSILLAFTRVWSVLAASRPVPPEGEELLMPLTRYLRERGAEVSGTDFTRSMYAFRMLAQSLADGLMPPGGYDVILSPTLAAPPAEVGALRDDADPQAEFAALGAFTPFTALYNATGQPAVNVPLQWNAAGLPIGVMLAGRYGDEATLIALSAQLEQARPWAGRTPSMW